MNMKVSVVEVKWVVVLCWKIVVVKNKWNMVVLDDVFDWFILVFFVDDSDVDDVVEELDDEYVD